MIPEAKSAIVRAARRLRSVPAIALVLSAAGGLLLAAGTAPPRGDKPETEKYLGYDRSIQLTPEQERVRVAALEALPAPCCKNFSAATCCCKCNMARATWGLAKYLIARQGYDAARVREAVAAWHHAINPRGFSGESCFDGGCGRPFAKDGCGGMKEGELVF